MSGYRGTMPGMPSPRPRLTGAALVLTGTVVILTAIAGILAVLAIITATPSGSASSPTPSPSAGSSASSESSPGASASAEPTESPSPSPSPTPMPTPPMGIGENILPPGSVIRISVDVRLRRQPNTSAKILATMKAGDLAFVVDAVDSGPVALGGYAWYQVAYAGGRDVWPWEDVGPPDEVIGWMAAGTASTRFATLADVSCPTEPANLGMLGLQLTSWERLVCLHGGPIVVEGTFGCDECSGDRLTGGEPAWLADAGLYRPIGGSYQSYPFIMVAIPPGVQPPQNRDIVRATLHVDDPAAASCTYSPAVDGGSNLTYDPAGAVLYCREALVLDSFEVLGTDNS